ncbi:DUF1569 domain-containing protein [Flavobacterium sp. HSC-61S13]|uniref:DUF1569 domain-containing protein n=1 Tax=Flavobacterium sp. HSC-61S13 TaxID=2910963 RepID=UPI00209FE8A8|nr:DUF1569 domain-containing protein [Flavobacterium sp. HSC-61S13]MCP1996404.1 hypothetical protein [Flavobacterium sp. HSC-61S13]
MKNIFNKEVTDEVIHRINRLENDTKPLWGTMNVAQMLSHCNVSYELVYEDGFPKPGTFKKLLLTWFVKQAVVSEKPYKKNGPTAPEFIIKETKDFYIEKQRLINYIIKTQELGENYFEGKQSHSFGRLKAVEWNNMFYKHLDHHLTQFGID